MTSEFLKAYWAYRRDGGAMSMSQYSQGVKELDAESRSEKMNEWRNRKRKVF